MPEYFLLTLRESENTKIRSVYRKLNRWGFSVLRKNVINSNNTWHHPDFHRTSAVKALKQSLETGKPIDLFKKGKKRTHFPGEDGYDDDDSTLPSMGNRDPSEQDLFRSPFLSMRASSMPMLPRVSSKQRKLAHSIKCNQQQQQSNLLSNHSLAGSNLRYSQSTNMIGRGGSSNRGTANATFDLLPSPRGGANATFPTIREGQSANATFDLNALSARANNRIMPPSNSLAPPANMFALSAQEILNNAIGRSAPLLGGTPIGSKPLGGTPLGGTSLSGTPLGGSTPLGGTNNKVELSAAQPSSPNGRELVDSEMTQEEDSELTAFFGNFALAMVPLREGEEEGDAER